MIGHNLPFLLDGFTSALTYVLQSFSCLQCNNCVWRCIERLNTVEQDGKIYPLTHGRETVTTCWKSYKTRQLGLLLPTSSSWSKARILLFIQKIHLSNKHQFKEVRSASIRVLTRHEQEYLVTLQKTTCGLGVLKRRDLVTYNTG